jgi:hypothetical protein
MVVMVTVHQYLQSAGAVGGQVTARAPAWLDARTCVLVLR